MTGGQRRTFIENVIDHQHHPVAQADGGVRDPINSPPRVAPR